ncbi:MAG: ATP-binding protein [Vicinamibacterales bacterium]
MAIDAAVRASIEKLLEGVQIIGFDWTYLYLNEAAERHARRPAGELLGRRMTDCYPGIERTPMFQALKRVMQARQPEQCLNEFTYPDGHQGWFELLIEPVPDGVCILSLDISDRQRAQAHLREAQKMEAVGRLAGGVAHDFNEVLTAMLGFCDLMLARAGDDRDLAADVLEMRRASERAEQLTRQLLALGRRQVLVPRVIRLNQVVAELHAMLARLLGDTIRLVLDTAPDLEPTRVDPSQLEQVLMNLVANARDAMPRGGTLRIATANVTLDGRFVALHPGSHQGEYVSLAVEDTGCGMSPELVALIFEPFFTTKARGHGSGLGLSTVYGIVKQSGGYITIDSRPGVGTTVTTYFPVADGPLAELEAHADLRTMSGAETILLVAEDPAERDLMRRTLAPQGYTVAEAGDVWEALTIARSRPGRIDLLVTDVVLSEMNGPQLAQHVVAMRPDLRVLYVAGFAEAGALGRGATSHRISFLPRPFAPGALLASVRDALDRPALQH